VSDRGPAARAAGPRCFIPSAFAPEDGPVMTGPYNRLHTGIRYTAFTSVINFVSDALASPKSMLVPV
jgi:hypothetical protein